MLPGVGDFGKQGNGRHTGSVGAIAQKRPFGYGPYVGFRSDFDRRMAMRTSVLILVMTAGFAFADDKANVLPVVASVAATVNGEEIKLADVDKVFRLKPKGGPPLTASMVR